MNELEEKRIKSLEMLQNIISRMANNSFLIKGWCLTLIVGFFVLFFDKNFTVTFLIFFLSIPIIFFWLMDGYFLSCERKFRNIYQSICDKDINNNTANKLFNYKFSDYVHKPKDYWVRSIFSKTLNIFYGGLIISIIIMGIAFHFINIKDIKQENNSIMKQNTKLEKPLKYNTKNEK